MNVSFEEIGRVAATFLCTDCAAGSVCKVIGNSKVTACGEGDFFCGVVESVREGFAAVQVGGFATVKFSGSMTKGFVNLHADGNGGVKVGQGREHLVVSVDQTAKTAVIKL